jgi:hypothetical protein
LVLIGLAGLVLLLMVARHHQPTELAVVLGPLVISGLLAHRFTDHFRRAPSGFPDASPSTGLRVTPTSRTGWASSHRKDAL